MESNKKCTMCLMLFWLTVFAVTHPAIGQIARDVARREGGSGNSAQILTVGAREMNIRKNPIQISFKGGVSVPADLIGPSPDDPDAVTVEIAGTRSSINLNEITIRQDPSRFDEYADLKFNDEKARLDNYAIQLQIAPGASGYIIGYGRCLDEGRNRLTRAVDYLVNTRSIDASRLATIDGGCRTQLMIELWVVPMGATPPSSSSEGIVEPCPNCKVVTHPSGGKKPRSSGSKKSRSGTRKRRP